LFWNIKSPAPAISGLGFFSEKPMMPLKHIGIVGGVRYLNPMADLMRPHDK
jgi:hypothetical protein